MENEAKNLKMIQTMANGYSSEKTQRENTNMTGFRWFLKNLCMLRACVLYEGSLSIGRVKVINMDDCMRQVYFHASLCADI